MGENSTRQARNGCCYNMHAEMDIIRKLPPLKFKAKKTNINLIVIRVDKFGLLKNSTPCSMCIKYMERTNVLTSYKINNIYYSDQNGNIIIRKLNELMDAPNKYITTRFKNKNKFNKFNKKNNKKRFSAN